MAPKGYVKDLMNYMVMPSASGVWNAVATSTDQTGVHESRPQSDDDWNKVIAAATELAESTNLLMMAGRKRYVGGAIPEAFLTDWRRKAREPALRRQVLTDGHAPAEYRGVTVRNLDAWYAAFHVEPGQGLYLAPDQRVRVW